MRPLDVPAAIRRVILGLRVWWFRRRPRSLGQRGERLAEQHVRRLGYKVVARGLRSRRGELDLVAVDGRTVVFIEVKTRRRDPEGDLLETVTPEKQRRLTRAASIFLKRHRLLQCASRFDVITIHWPHRSTPRLRHYPRAFEAQGGDSLY